MPETRSDRRKAAAAEPAPAAAPAPKRKTGKKPLKSTGSSKPTATTSDDEQSQLFLEQVADAEHGVEIGNPVDVETARWFHRAPQHFRFLSSCCFTVNLMTRART